MSAKTFPGHGNMRSMTSSGSPYARFRRALATGNLHLATAAAAELPKLNLADAMAVLALIAAQDPTRYPRAAARWAGRLALERPDVSLAELRLAIAALTELPERPELERVLHGLLAAPTSSRS